jgi:hypothetical protein
VRLRSGTRASGANRAHLLVRHALYVLAFLVLWLWPIIHRFLDEDDNNMSLTGACRSGKRCWQLRL